jgi:hypothetical protein
MVADTSKYWTKWFFGPAVGTKIFMQERGDALQEIILGAYRISEMSDDMGYQPPEGNFAGILHIPRFVNFHFHRVIGL